MENDAVENNLMFPLCLKNTWNIILLLLQWKGFRFLFFFFYDNSQVIGNDGHGIGMFVRKYLLNEFTKFELCRGAFEFWLRIIVPCVNLLNTGCILLSLICSFWNVQFKPSSIVAIALDQSRSYQISHIRSVHFRYLPYFSSYFAE